MNATPPGRIAGVDFGTVRIGIAISDPGRIIASPYENYDRQSADLDAERFQRLVLDESIVLFVVGLPIHLDGRESQKSREARVFAQGLREQTGLPVELFDERFTTAHATQLLRDAKTTRKKQKKRLDMVAAQILLSAYLDAGCPREIAENEPIEDEPE